MNKTLKKLLSGFISLSMLCSMAAIPVFADDMLPTDELLLDITFDESGTGTGSFTATTGGTVTEHGSVAYVDNYDGSSKALSITTDAAGNYLELPKGILNGKDAATFTFWIKPSSRWAFMTTPVSGSQDYLNEKYLGMLASPSSFTAERYNNSGTRLSSVSANGTYTDWQYVTTVFTANGTKIYVNGSLIASDTAAVDIASLFTADASTWIGHGNWGTGEGFSGMMDDFRIYGKALSDDEITALSAKAVEREKQKLVKEKDRLEINTQFYDADGNKVFQIKAGDSIKIKTSVTNYTPSVKSITCDVIAYDSSDNQLPGTASAPVELDILENEEWVNDVTCTNDVAYYKVLVRDILADDIGDYDAGYLPVANVSFPDASPADSAATTEGVHDPTLFKDPVSGKYYVYSSHNLVFESTDLINWTKHDYTSTITVPETAKTFIENNYSGTTANTTYWAPDILYKEGDEYPYWFYLSTSCGLGGRNSVISLVKAKSPGLWDGEYEDAGVVMASKESSAYNTNSIDANIFTDSDGKTYFIWGSFWKGIYMAELDTDTGRVKGVDYTSDATILSSTQNFGTRMFSTPAGVTGPEGPYTVYNEDNGYRYMFTSYGWLGTNYNIRVARTDKTFAEVLADTNPHKQLLDQQGRPVGATYVDQVKEGGTLDELWGYKMSGSFQLGDGIEYLGSGHNSVFKDDDGSWYLIQHCRKVADAVAYLQVKKILWTEDGWPVISPLVYAGEEEQEIPEEMLYGTWDLSSVGHTILEDGVTDVSKSGAYKGSDLPVHSSEIILQPDGNLGDNLGTWEYDGDHTVTITFAYSGDSDKYEFYKAGDTMTLYALTGYDKDKQESAIVLTGTDQNGIASFAKKNNQVAQITRVTPRLETVPTVISKSAKGNPMLGFDTNGNITYGGDPSVLVDGDTVYVYAGHDTSTNDSYVIPEYICYSSKDLVNWDYHGSVFAVNSTTVPWASGSTSAWASQVLKHDGKYYLYYCTWGNSTYKGYQCIGVAVADSPTGPFTNASTTPLINGYTMTTENSSGWNDIDPTGWIETDANGVEHIYLNWGNTENYTCELNSDMVSVKDINGDGQITSADIKHTTINNIDGVYTEAPYLYRRTDENGNYTGKYYMFFAKDWREQWAYATTDDIMSGSWDYGSLVMSAPATSNTSHGAVFDFNGKTYYLYHNGALPGGSGFRRVANIQEIKFNDDGAVVPMTELSIGLSGTASAISTADGKYIGHEVFTNPLDDTSYPLVKSTIATTDNSSYNTRWEIEQGKADTSNENYVSIQAVDKPGLYLTVSGYDVIITQQDTTGAELAERMTFKTVEGINGADGMISFESVAKPGYFLTVSGASVELSDGINPDACSFNITDYSVSDIAYSNGTLSFNVTSAALDDTITAYIAEYDINGILKNISIKNDILINSITNNVEFSYTPSADAVKVKLFVWKNMKPLLSDNTDITSIVIPSESE